MSCGVGHRHRSDPVLLWLWCRPAATAPIRPLAWESPYVLGAAQEMEKKDQKKMLNESGMKWNSCHFPNLREKAFISSKLRMMSSMALSYIAFIMWQYISFIPTYLKQMLNFVK